MRGDGFVFQRGKSWWVGYRMQGKFKREPAKVVGREGILRPAATEQEALRFLRARRNEILGGRFVGPVEEKLTVAALLDALETRAVEKNLRSRTKVTSHAKPLRAFFALRRAVEVTPEMLSRFKAERKLAGKASATINRSLEVLRQAFRLAMKHKQISAARVPDIEMLSVDNIRTGFFERAEVEALLAKLGDANVRDFVEWGFRTGMRKGEIAQLKWEMLDRANPKAWVLRIPGAITKNARPRSLRLEGEVRTIIERRLDRRRLDCALVFHRESKGKSGQPVKGIDGAWRTALKEANLPAGRLFHDLRRSAVRTLIKAGVDPSVAMKVSGHKTRSMLDRYRIVDEDEIGAAFEKADAYLSTQPAHRPVLPFPAAAAMGNAHTSLTDCTGNSAVPPSNPLAFNNELAEAGGNRTHRPGG